MQREDIRRFKRGRRKAPLQKYGTIHCFRVFGAGNTWFVIAMAEDGVQLACTAAHTTDEQVMRYLIGSTWKGCPFHREYRLKYPNGYRMVWHPRFSWRRRPEVVNSFLHAKRLIARESRGHRRSLDRLGVRRESPILITSEGGK